MTVDGSGNLYVADTSNATIRMITPTGVVTTLAGSPGSAGSSDGSGAAARFNQPAGVAVDAGGTIYVADRNNQTVRKITPAGVVTTLAGTPGTRGASDGTGTATRFSNPSGVAVDSSGNLYVADQDNHTIRKITSAGVVTTLAGAATVSGSADGTGTAARFLGPSGVAVDGAGNAYVADLGNCTIRKVTASGVVTTLAGLARSCYTADGVGTAARFYYPSSVAVDKAGNVYVGDHESAIIRKISADGTVTTLAGSSFQWGNVDGTGAAARFYHPSDVAVDDAGNVYVADTGNSVIRRITPTGTTTTIAGMTGVSGILLGAAPLFASPRNLAIAGDSIVITDTNAILVLRHGVR